MAAAEVSAARTADREIVLTRIFDVRPGGVWRFVMHGPDGHNYKNKINFREIVENERLTYTQIGENEDPNQFEVTVTFAPEGTNTKLTPRMVFTTATERDRVVKEYGAIEGGQQTLERLAHHLGKIEQAVVAPPKETFVLTRVLDAPTRSRLPRLDRSEAFQALVGARRLRCGALQNGFAAGWNVSLQLLDAKRTGDVGTIGVPRDWCTARLLLPNALFS